MGRRDALLQQKLSLHAVSFRILATPVAQAKTDLDTRRFLARGLHTSLFRHMIVSACNGGATSFISKVYERIFERFDPMPLLPNDWNVVVVGHWNRAILSPAGIAKRLFGLPEGTPVQVLVPLDVVAPYHIRHEDITVIPSSDRLLVCPVHETYINLVAAIDIARKALVDLPHTPVFAAGMNLSFSSPVDLEVLQQATVSVWDDKLSDKGFLIASRSIMRSVHWREGTINVTITCSPSGACSVMFNFDFKSSSTDAIEKWLKLKAEEIKAKVDLILYSTIGLSPEDIGNV